MDQNQPSREPEQPRGSRGPGEKKHAPQTSNAIWYLLALGVLTLLVVVGWRTSREEEISYSDLNKLVEASNPSVPKEQRYIELKVGTGENRRTVRYSELSDVVIHLYEVTGTVTRTEIPPSDRSKKKAVNAADKDAADKHATQDATHKTDPAANGSQPAAEPPQAEGQQEPSAETQQTEVADAKQPAGASSSSAAGNSSKSGPARQEVLKAVPFTTDRQPDETLLAERLDANGVPFSYAKGPSAWRNYALPLITIGLMALLVYVMMRRLGGAGSPMAFGRSRGRLYAQEDIEILFDDVAGIEEAVEEVREIVEFLRTPEKYQKLGGRIPKGVLLVGPPGTGKTLLSKAIAGEAGVPFFSLSGSDFVEMFVGVGAARVRDMFQQAEAKAPCIIFIDELDALGKTRGSGSMGGHDEREQTLNALLVEMDGFDSDSGVIVLGATNRPETLDPALLRPGRFDRHVLVDRPDVKGREQILNVHLRNVKVGSTVNVKQIAAITSGFVGADLANLVNEAALLAARKGLSSVGMQEFNEGVERITAGLEKKQRIMQDDEKRRVAYHESGHALVACCLPNTDPVHKVSIIPRGLAALGYTMQRPEQDRFLMTRGELESRIQVLLGGTIAEEMIFDDISTGAQNDLERASEIARSMVMDFGMSRLGRVTYRESGRSPFLVASGDGSSRLHNHSEQTAREIDEEVKRIIDEAIEQVRLILQAHKKALVAMAKVLQQQEVIDADELQAIMEEHSPSPRIVPGTDVEPKRAAAADFDSSEMLSDPERAEGG